MGGKAVAPSLETKPRRVITGGMTSGNDTEERGNRYGDRGGRYERDVHYDRNDRDDRFSRGERYDRNDRGRRDDRSERGSRGGGFSMER